jgi:hypothetical protein
MKNMNDLGVHELNSSELTETNGGFLVPIIIGLAFVAGVIAGSKDKEK